MFLYPEKIESTLHVTQIKNWVLDYCLSSLGRERIAAQATYANAIELERELRKVNEFKNLLMLGIPFPSDGYHDLKEDLKYVHIENYVLDAEQFIRIKSSVIAIDQIHQFFKVFGFRSIFGSIADFHKPFQRLPVIILSKKCLHHPFFNLFLYS